MILIITSVNVILLILNPLGLSIWNSYLAERGKGLATKKDIEEITTKVKKVESLFSISTSSEIDYNTLKRKAILDYFNSLNTWVSLIASNTYKFEKEKIHENDMHFDKIRDAYIEFLIKEEGLHLFIPSHPFSVYSNNCTQKVIKLSSNYDSYITKIKKAYKESNDDELKAKQNIKIAQELYSKELLNIYSEYLEEKKELIKLLDAHIDNTFKTKKEA